MIVACFGIFEIAALPGLLSMKNDWQLVAQEIDEACKKLKTQM